MILMLRHTIGSTTTFHMGPGFLGWLSSNYTDFDKYSRAVDRVRNFQCPGLGVDCKEFHKIIPYHNSDFLYCDPPYYLGKGSSVFKGIYPQRNFPIHHDGFNHFKLAQLLRKHQGGFVLSYNDCRQIRYLYRDYDIIELEWQYSMGNGGDKDRKESYG